MLETPTAGPKSSDVASRHLINEAIVHKREKIVCPSCDDKMMMMKNGAPGYGEKNGEVQNQRTEGR